MKDMKILDSRNLLVFLGDLAYRINVEKRTLAPIPKSEDNCGKVFTTFF